MHLSVSMVWFYLHAYFRFTSLCHIAIFVVVFDSGGAALCSKINFRAQFLPFFLEGKLFALFSTFHRFAPIAKSVASEK